MDKYNRRLIVADVAVDAGQAGVVAVYVCDWFIVLATQNHAELPLKKLRRINCAPKGVPTVLLQLEYRLVQCVVDL